MLLRSTLLYLPAQILGPLLQFLAILAWGWWLEPRQMGIFTIIAATQELGYLLFLSWFSAFALRHHAEEARKDRSAWHAAENLVIAAAAMLNAGLALATLVFVLGLAPRPALAVAAAAFMALRSVNAHMAERARAAGRIGAYTILQVAGPGLGLLFGLALHAATGADATGALGAYALAHMLAIALAAPLTGMRPAPLRRGRQLLRRALAYGLPLVLAGGFSWLALNAVRYVAEGFAGAAAAGLVAIGLGLGQRGTSFAAMFVTSAAFPLAVKALNEHGEAAAMRQLSAGGALLIAALAPATAGLLAIGKDISTLLVAESYRAATAAILPWAVLMGAARNLRSHYPDQVFLLRNDSAMVMRIDALDAALTLAGATAGYLAAGLAGSVAGAAAGAAMAAAVSFALAAGCRHFAFPWGDAVRALAASAAMAAALAAAPPAAHAAALAAKVAAGAGLYALALAALYPLRLLHLLRLLRTRLPGACPGGAPRG